MVSEMAATEGSEHLCRLSAIEIARAIAAGEVTALEVTNAHLARIEAVDGKIHAFLHVDHDGARTQANAVDAKVAAGQALGPLAGVPVALKDVFAQQDVPTTAGSRSWKVGSRRMTRRW